MKDAFRFEERQCLGECNAAIDGPPSPGMAKVGKIEPVAAHIFEAGEGTVELGLQRILTIATEALNKTIFPAMPFAKDIDRIVEAGRADLGQESRLQYLLDESLTGFADRVLLILGRHPLLDLPPHPRPGGLRRVLRGGADIAPVR